MIIRQIEMVKEIFILLRFKQFLYGFTELIKKRINYSYLLWWQGLLKIGRHFYPLSHFSVWKDRPVSGTSLAFSLKDVFFLIGAPFSLIVRIKTRSKLEIYFLPTLLNFKLIPTQSNAIQNWMRRQISLSPKTHMIAFQTDHLITSFFA